MELKSNVKNRRRERIRQLQAGSPTGPQKQSQAMDGKENIAEFSDEPRAARYDKRWEDPEFVWKEREKQLLERSYRFPGGGGYDEHDLPTAIRRMSPRKTVVQLLVCLCLFGGIWLLFHSEGEWPEKGQAAVRRVFNEEFPFTRVEAWYTSSFGDSASWIPAFGGKDDSAAKVTVRAGKGPVLPVQGTVAVPFSTSTGGVLLGTRADAPVYVMDEGRVLFAGNRQDTGYTVVVAHANGLESSYGFLQPGKWQKNDWVQAGDLIGKAGAQDADKTKGKVFIVLRKNNAVVNPAEGIRFD